MPLKVEKTSDMSPPAYVYVDRSDQLPAVLQACEGARVIALDTEFARFNTYYPIVGLIQIYDGETCFLIDPLEVSITPLADVLTSTHLTKVLHACSEDIEVFQHTLGVVPEPVYDTQIAGAVLGVGFSVGYQAIVEHYLDINLPKDQTRSDWLARPLSADQLDYAALDVIHLLEVYRKQQEALVGSHKLEWVEAEVAALGENIPTVTPPEECYLKLKGLWQFNRRQLNLLKVLCAWREVTARTEDVPRNRVVDQKALMTIVRDSLTGKHDLQKVAGMSPRQVRRYGDEIMFLQAEAKLVPEHECPELVERTDAPINNKKLKKLRQVVDERAKMLEVAPELLSKRRHLEKLIRSEDHSGRFRLPGELDGWRKEAVGDALLKALAE